MIPIGTQRKKEETLARLTDSSEMVPFFAVNIEYYVLGSPLMEKDSCEVGVPLQCPPSDTENTPFSLGYHPL